MSFMFPAPASSWASATLSDVQHTNAFFVHRHPNKHLARYRSKMRTTKEAAWRCRNCSGGRNGRALLCADMAAPRNGMGSDRVTRGRLQTLNSHAVRSSGLVWVDE